MPNDRPTFDRGERAKIARENRIKERENAKKQMEESLQSVDGMTPEQHKALTTVADMLREQDAKNINLEGQEFRNLFRKSLNERDTFYIKDGEIRVCKHLKKNPSIGTAQLVEGFRTNEELVDFLNQQKYIIAALLDGGTLPESKPEPVLTETVEAESVPTTPYTIQSGDTLWDIAQRYTDADGKKLTWQQIQTANNIKTTTIYPGQKITIPAGYTTQTTEETAQTLRDQRKEKREEPKEPPTNQEQTQSPPPAIQPKQKEPVQQNTNRINADNTSGVPPSAILSGKEEGYFASANLEKTETPQSKISEIVTKIAFFYRKIIDWEQGFEISENSIIARQKESKKPILILSRDYIQKILNTKNSTEEKLQDKEFQAICNELNEQKEAIKKGVLEKETVLNKSMNK